MPENQYDEIILNSKGVIQYAADALQKSFIEGLSVLNEHLLVMNLPFIGSWPIRYKSIFSPLSFNQSYASSKNHYNLCNKRFFNLTGLKMLSRYAVLKKTLKDYCTLNRNEPITILIYSIHTPFLKAVIDVKKIYSNMKIILIVPDLPEYMSENQYGIIGVIRGVNIRFQNSLYDKIDGFVILSEYMKSRLITNNQPYCVVEGIYNSLSDDIILPNIAKKEKIIFYSGTLARRYCIMNLVNAITKLDRQDVRLDIYGDGECKNEIIEISKRDHRINYCGQQPRKEILKRQREAVLLVNPRTAEGEFTKYSFPSKTMEYLASGTPTLIYRLPGIPDEYYKHCFSIKDSDIDILSETINEILDMDSDTLSKLGIEARNFILDNKNPYKQTQKVIDLINILNK